MAPIRRYLRISKYSVLECRIYLDNPADTRWLLDSRDAVLQRVFQTIRPLVLPKIREENERARAKKKSKPVKDVIAEDDFEVSIFLRESGTRHSIVTRQKNFKGQPSIVSNSNKLTGADYSPVQIEDDSEQRQILVESDEETGASIRDISEAPPESESEPQAENTERPSRRRRRGQTAGNNGQRDNGHASKKARTEEQPATDEKKPGVSTTYEGFSIWGWTLCLLITRKGDKGKKPKTAADTGSQAIMEDWISTQAPQDFEEG